MNTQQHDKSRDDQPKGQTNQQQPAFRRSLGEGIRAMRADCGFAWLISLFIALNVADLVVTLVGLRLGRFEGNPLFNSLFSRSVVTASVLKLFGTLLLTTILLTTFSTMPRLTRWVAVVLCLILAAFVANDVWTVVRLLAR